MSVLVQCFSCSIVSRLLVAPDLFFHLSVAAHNSTMKSHRNSTSEVWQTCFSYLSILTEVYRSKLKLKGRQFSQNLHKIRSRRMNSHAICKVRWNCCSYKLPLANSCFLYDFYLSHVLPAATSHYNSINIGLRSQMRISKSRRIQLTYPIPSRYKQERSCR